MEAQELYQKSLEKWGKNSQLIMAIEEMSELMNEITKELRGRQIDTEHLTEEIADVEIMMGQLENIFKNGEAVKAIKVEKLERLVKRLNDGKTYFKE